MRKLVNGRPWIRNTKSLTALGENPGEMLLDASSTLAVSTMTTTTAFWPFLFSLIEIEESRRSVFDAKRILYSDWRAPAKTELIQVLCKACP